MNKKHFEYYASMFADIKLMHAQGSTIREAYDFYMAMMIDSFKDFNPKFDEDKFRARVDQRVASKNAYGPLTGGK